MSLPRYSSSLQWMRMDAAERAMSVEDYGLAKRLAEQAQADA